MVAYKFRLVDVVELYMTEKERNDENRVKLDGKGRRGYSHNELKEELVKSDERLKGYLAWIEVKNANQTEVDELKEKIRKFREGYQTRLKYIEERNIYKWDRGIVEREVNRRVDEGLSFMSRQLIKVDYGLDMAVRSYVGNLWEMLEKITGFNKQEYEENLYGGIRIKKQPKQKYRKYSKKTSKKETVRNYEGYTKEDGLRLLETRKSNGLSNEIDVLRCDYGKDLHDILREWNSVNDLLESFYGEETAKRYVTIKKSKKSMVVN